MHKETISQKIVAFAAANSQLKRVTQSIVSSGSQKPLLRTQGSAAGGSNASLSQSLTTTGTKVSKFSALKAPKSIEANPKDPNLSESSSVLDFSNDSNPSTDIVVATIPAAKTCSVPTPKTGYSPVPPTTMSSGSKFSRFKKTGTPRPSSGAATLPRVPPVVTVGPNPNVANLPSTTSSTPTQCVRSVQSNVKGSWLFGSLPRKSFN